MLWRVKHENSHDVSNQLPWVFLLSCYLEHLSFSTIVYPPSPSAIHARVWRSQSLTQVFVTGNANKLKEVKAILAKGDSGIECTSQAVDGEFRVASFTKCDV